MTADGEWLFERAVARVEPAVEALLAEYATSYVGRPVQRRESRPPDPAPGVTWSIDGEPLVDFVHRAAGPDRLVVHDISLLDALKKQIRSGHVAIEYVGSAVEP